MEEDGNGSVNSEVDFTARESLPVSLLNMTLEDAIKDTGSEDVFMYEQGERKQLCTSCSLLHFSILGLHGTNPPPQVICAGQTLTDLPRDYLGVKETAKFCGFCQKVVRYFESFSPEKPEDSEDLAWQEEQEYVQYHISDLPSVEIGEDGELIAQLYRMDIHLFIPAMKETLDGFKSITYGMGIQRYHVGGTEPSGSPQHISESEKGWVPHQTVAKSRPYSGRIRDPLVSTPLLRSWKDICFNSHADACRNIFTGTRTSGMRVIDVNKRCITNLQDHDDYLVLSYVWGTAPVPRLTRATFDEYQKCGALHTYMLPATIEDALSVVRSLGEKFIWVDSLCIIQDDPSDKLSFIPNMDSIYGCALITIVAASGTDAHSGLPGIRSLSSRRVRVPFVVNGVPLLETCDAPGWHDSRLNSRAVQPQWATRGWTFQERLFSKRTLTFRPEQAFWECGKGTWCEDGFWESTKSPTIYRHSFNDSDIRWPWKGEHFERIYWELVRDFTARDLTNQEDGMNAFMGVIRAFQRDLNQSFFWALPLSLMESALAWPSNLDRRDAEHSQKSSDGSIISSPFPSWSWVGWIGRVTYKTPNLIPVSLGLAFHIVDADGTFQKISTPESIFNLDYDVGWLSPSFASSVLNAGLKTTVELLDLPPKTLSSPLAMTLLCFWTFSMPIPNIDSDCFLFFLQKLQFGIFDENDFLWTLRHVESPTELIAVARFKQKRTASKNESDEIRLLLITWKEGVAYRLGVLSIYVSDWNLVDYKVWKLIVLG